VFFSYITTLVNQAIEGSTAISNAVYELCNGLAGRSWLFDNLVALAQTNSLVKAALLGGCFLAAWHGDREDATVRRKRHILIVTLIASVFVMATTKAISTEVLLPRPYIQSQKVFHLEGNRLVENAPVPYHVPSDDANEAKYEDLLNGKLSPSDLTAFPSDHAGLYVTLALGILMASPALGWLALSWTFLVLLGSRVITGEHSPLDIMAGAAIGAVILLLFQHVFANSGKRAMQSVVNWTLEHQAVASALLFVVVFETTNTMQDVQALLDIGAAVVDHYWKG
jgi:membrane-associated phospholipid phosphatase